METQTDPNQNPPKTKRHIFILSGQSNMSGRGGVIKNPHHTPNKRWNGVIPPECSPDSSILRFSSTLKWEQAHEPLHADIDNKKVCGIGPGMSFANAVRQRVAGELGLVPCAVGGTAIKEWARGEELYENMVKRSKESVKGDENAEIKALLWYQGESDTSSEHDAEVYKANMENLIHNVALASGFEYIEKVREAQKGINISNVICIDAKGLQLKEDNLHLNTEAQIKLGHMLAEAYLTHFDV
ncbi:unnamed protein product [Trifolium pratense]|uniref:Uncharacterized protein n=1 Tax=Trifolium pratense TaxID=57577 RepID=A0ACB0IEQ0_TRIPR|nr:unnamed protein product [Trifolium pratense]